MKKQNLLLIGLLILVFATRFVLALPTKTQVEEFKGMDALEVKTTSGDCIIIGEKTKIIRVEIEYSESIADVVKPEFIERGKTLKIKERWHGSGSGNIIWRITVPKDMDIEFSSASGDVDIEACSGEMEFETASGDIKISECAGEIEISSASGDVDIESSGDEFDISTASGDIVMEECQGFVELSTASGDVEINDIEGALDISTASGDVEVESVLLNEDSDFSTASGDIELTLAQIPDVTLDLSAASGDLTLDLDGQKPAGVIQCITRKDRGRIKSDFRFDKEEEFEKNNRTYLKKTIDTGKAKPQMYLETASGNIAIKR